MYVYFDISVTLNLVCVAQGPDHHSRNLLTHSHLVETLENDIWWLALPNFSGVTPIVRNNIFADTSNSLMGLGKSVQRIFILFLLPLC
jgi:hypothetical protein